jgi:hypothetical protein
MTLIDSHKKYLYFFETGHPQLHQKDAYGSFTKLYSEYKIHHRIDSQEHMTLIDSQKKNLYDTNR